MNPDSQDSEGRTPLSWAIDEGKVAVVELMKENYARLRLRDNEDPPLPGIGWGEYEYTETVRILLQNNASMDLKDNKGRTPLNYALQIIHYDADRNFSDWRELCLEFWVNVFRNNSGSTSANSFEEHDQATTSIS